MKANMNDEVQKKVLTMNPEPMMRFNNGKADWTLIDFDSIEEAVRVMEYGASKYERDNWQTKCSDPKSQILAPAMRHLIKIIKGEEVDDESGRLHAGHVIANMMIYMYQKRNYQF